MADTVIVGRVLTIDEVAIAETQPAPASETSERGRRSRIHFQMFDGDVPTEADAVLELETEAGQRHERILRGLRRLGRPALVEQSADRVITNVLRPMVGRVMAIREHSDGRLLIQLDLSSASHFIAQTPDTKTSIDVLRASLASGDVLLVTENEARTEIVDVRPCPRPWTPPRPPDTALPEVAEGQEAAILPSLLQTLTPQSQDQIVTLFKAMAQRTCRIPETVAECLPFRLVRDGCCPRAHRMCHLLNDEHGVVAGKIWLFPTGAPLRPLTPNRPECQASWVLHVAPVVRVEGTDDLMVIDPSIFDRPVTVKAFIAAMREPTEERFSAQKIFFKANANDRGRTEVLQASLTGLGEVADEFAELREELHTMSPPPPFAQCLVMN